MNRWTLELVGLDKAGRRDKLSFYDAKVGQGGFTANHFKT